MPFVNDGYGCVYQTSDPARGTAEIYWRPLHPIYDNADSVGALPPSWNAGDSDWAFRLLARIKAKSWQYDSKPPFSWLVNVRPARTLLGGWLGEYENLASSIHLFVAPHVALKAFDVDPGYWYWEPDLTVVRLDSVEEVPLPGREVSLSDLLGERPLLEYFSGTLQGADLRADERGRIALSAPTEDSATARIDTRMLPSIHITRGPNTFTIERKGHYGIVVTLPETEPGFFRIAIMDPSQVRTGADVEDLPPQWREVKWSTGVNRLELHATWYRIIHDPATTVEFWMDAAESALEFKDRTAKVETRTVPHSPGWGPPPLLPMQLRSEVTEPKVIIRDNFANLSDPSRIEAVIDFTAGNWTEIDPDPAWWGLDTVFQLGIGFVPVLGQLYDVADVVSIAVTGKDLWGAKKTKTDMMLIGMFSMLGVLGDLSRKVDIGQAERIGKYLFGDAKIVSANPNYVRTIVRAAFAGCPALSHATTQMADEIGDATLREMDRLIAAGNSAGLEALVRQFDAQLVSKLMANAASIPFDSQPAILAILRHHKIHFRSLIESSAALNKTTMSKILKTWDDAFASDTFDDLLNAIDGLDATTGKIVRDMLHQRIIEDINNDPAIIRRAAAYFARYGKPYTPYGYLVNVAGKGTEAREAFELKYGRKALSILAGKRLIPSVDEIIAQYKDVIPGLIHRIDLYEDLVEFLRTTYPNLGYVLNRDHLLEDRFRKVSAHVESVDATQFKAMLVVASQDVARKLRAIGINAVWYVHTEKTERLRQLLPHEVVDYEVQEIADAYQLFWVHEMQMSPDDFTRHFEEEFHYLDLARKGALNIDDGKNINTNVEVFTVAKTREQLQASLDLLHTRMDMPEWVKRKVGARVSNSAGL